MKQIFTYIWLLAGLMACSNEDNISNEQQPAAQAQVYHVCIPASMGDDSQTRAVSFYNSGATPTITATFATTEKVYVYNKSKTTMLGNYLTPSNLSNENKNCDLTGDLTGDIDENDELYLLYNADDYGDFNYYSQNGLATGVKDGAKAVVTVSATSPLTTSFAHFANVQSMFRFKFVDEGSTPINVASLTIYDIKGAITRELDGRFDSYENNSIHVSPSPATSDYLYAGICFWPSHQIDGNKIVFLASDGTYLYRGKKEEPASGFINGKYYYNTTPIQLTKEGTLQEPTITWTAPSSPVALYENDYYGLNVDNAEISVTGTSYGYRFLLTDYDTPATIHLNGLTATRFEEWFIYSYYNSVTLDINGANSITCDDADRCVSASQNLKLSGNGTLTVTCNNASTCGFYGGSNYNSSNNSYATTTEVDVSTQLAATGYTVTRSARTDNGDGTYSWTYTVAGPPANAINGKFTINASGNQVYFSQGNLRATYNGTAWSWGFAAHQYDYIGNAAGNTSINGNGTLSDNGTVDLFSWSSEQSYYGINTSENNSYYTGTFSDWGNNVIGGDAANTWRTLTSAEWTYLFNTRTTTSGYRYVLAMVNGRGGVILLPDDWDTSNYSLYNYNDYAYVNYSSNDISSTDWANIFEAHGAVFLPAAGDRSGKYVYDVGQAGYYWSSTPDNYPYSLKFEQQSTMSGAGPGIGGGMSQGTLEPASGIGASLGCSVRLVRDAN